jgi:hypothetical protein
MIKRRKGFFVIWLKYRKDLNNETGIANLILVMQQKVEDKNDQAKSWLRRFGVAGFVFFLVKGLLWLIVPAVSAYFSLN